ncbi:MAG: type II/IV secretion system protein [Bdellovibrionales bacterium]|nr:type II/IV secretion system protein [Bdellovibrionales bacterium]
MNADSALLKLMVELGLLQELPPALGLSAPNTNADGPLLSLAKQGKLNELEAIKAISKKLGVPYLDLTDQKLIGRLRPEKYREQFDAKNLLQHKCIPLFEENGALQLAIANPLDLEAYKGAEFAAQSAVRLAISEEQQIVRLLEQHFLAAPVKFDSFDEVDVQEYLEIVGNTVQEENLDEHSADAPPIVRLCNKLIVDGVHDRASDIHIEPATQGLEVRHRVDGVMRTVLEIPRRLRNYVIARFKILSGMDISEKRRPQDGRLRIRLGGETVDMRVSCIPTAHGEKIVLRILRTDSQMLTFDALGFSNDSERRIRRTLSARGKMFLVTGPTGSGKTTTLYTALNFLNDGSTNIVTVEDPIEYRIAGINQTQVNEASGMTFASALRSILRQDPDVIMIGEIRDAETADIALQAAQTGHLVLSTLHTNDAPSAIARLLNLEVDRFVLASSIGGILAQRLVRKLCLSCREGLSSEIAKEHLDLIEYYKLNPKTLFQAKGCQECKGSGYKGRTGLYSYLDVTEDVSNLVHSAAPLNEIEKIAGGNGYKSISQSALELLTGGVCDFHEVYPYLVYSDEEKSHEAMDLSSHSTGESPSLVGNSVCLIEPDDSIRERLKELLLENDFRVLEGGQLNSGDPGQIAQCAILIIDEQAFEGADPAALIPTLKNKSGGHEQPLVIITGIDSQLSASEWLELGAAGAVSRGSSSYVLLDQIKRLIVAQS